MKNFTKVYKRRVHKLYKKGTNTTQKGYKSEREKSLPEVYKKLMVNCYY